MVYKEKKFVREVHTGTPFTLDQVVYLKSPLGINDELRTTNFTL